MPEAWIPLAPGGHSKPSVCERLLIPLPKQVWVLPSGEDARRCTWRPVCHAGCHPERQLTLMFVSWEPEATNSPYGWKSKLQMLALCPMSVRRTEKAKESRGCGMRASRPGRKARLQGASLHCRSNCCTRKQTNYSSTTSPRVFLLYRGRHSCFYASSQETCACCAQLRLNKAPRAAELDNCT